ncbi:MAG: hypothetical protein PHS02_00040 [Candidatus ainarchaeum sp.]|nr:hypothetical protein [Candidatus ainarchaeum sp.]
MVQLVGEQVSDSPVLLVIGGGRGELARLLSTGAEKKRVLNFDIAEMKSAPVVPTTYCDMEVGIPFSRIEQDGLKVAAITPFSLEYTNVGVSSGNIAAVLLPGDRFIWLCHHSDSPINANLRSERQIYDIVDVILAEAKLNPSSKWYDLAKRYEPIVFEICGLDSYCSLVNCDTETFLRRLEIIDTLSCMGDMKTANAMGLVSALRLGYENPERREACIRRIDDTRWIMMDEVILSSLFLEYNLRTPDDLKALVDPRFRMNGSRVFYDNDRPAVIVGLFERT